MNTLANTWHCRFRIVTALLSTVALLGGIACTASYNNTNAPNTSGGTDDDDSNGSDGGNTGGTDDNVLLTEPLGYEGSLSGKVADSQSTRNGGDSASAQNAPPAFDTDNTCVRFQDLAGRPLRDADGQPIPEVPVTDDGSFEADGLPVGTDFTVCADIGKDAECDVESCVHVPSDDGSAAGRLTDVQVDPLTTIILARLRSLLSERSIDISELPISPATVVSRIVAAFRNHFEEAGIDLTISLDDIADGTDESLAALFDERIPQTVRVGMDIVAGNLQAAQASDDEALVLAAAEIFLRAGFPIADLPTAPDLSVLAALENVSVIQQRDFFGGARTDHPSTGTELDELPQEVIDVILAGGTIEDIPEEYHDLIPEEYRDDPTLSLTDLLLDPPATQLAPGDLLSDDVVILVSDLIEPDRNRIAGGREKFADRAPGRPVISDRALLEMARLHREGRTVTLADLYDLLTDLSAGLGLRLTYFFHDPGFAGQPLTIFQTDDGHGLAINLNHLYQRILAEGVNDIDTDTSAQREEELRRILMEQLGGTTVPSFERLFGGFAIERVTSAEVLAQRIRDALAHLPYSRSGPSTLFVVADADIFDPDRPGRPVTVDATIDPDGTVRAILYNDTDDGLYHLGLTRATDARGMVELLVRETGRPLHGPRGPFRASVFDGTIFRAANGLPFSSLVSSSGARYPVIHVPVIDEEFVLQDLNTDSMREVRIPMLATDDGDSAELVRVHYDPSSGIATYNEFGRFLLMLLPDSHETGAFALFNEGAGKPVSTSDPERFFERPTDLPPDFEDVFNETDEFEDPTVATDDTTSAESDAPATDESNTTIDPPAERFLDSGDFIMVAAANIEGLDVSASEFRHVFGVEVPNPRYEPEGDPYFDDINANEIQDPDEPSAPYLPVLFDPQDWRSTDIRLYYRRADDNGAVALGDVAFDASEPQTTDGVALVPRMYRPRLNAFRFGRPNAATNLLTAFLPPNFFDGTHGLDRNSAVQIFSAVAVINLVMEQVFNVEADVDVDGFGPQGRRRMLIDAQPFVVPVKDPFALIIRGFGERSQPASDGN